MVELFANSGDPDQTPHSGASDLGLHCLPITLLGVSRLQWVKTVVFLVFLQKVMFDISFKRFSRRQNAVSDIIFMDK